jgi:leucyl aminopeptidase (aminopeptidase T)
MAEHLSGGELVALVKRVFVPQPGEKALAILVDLPDAQVADNTDWAARRAIAQQWVEALTAHRAELGMDTSLVLYPNVHTNNGDLPERCWVHRGGPLPQTAEALDPAASIAFAELYAGHPILIAPTEFSATAPLKMAAKKHPIRAATMPGFRQDMIPALRLDYTEVNRRVEFLKNLLDRATGADFTFVHPGGEDTLHLDLRFRSAHASGGLLPSLGVAGNLPSGEAYIVPFEGESEPSRSAGVMPVQFGSEVVRYRIAANKAVEVLTQGVASKAEAEHLAAEPAYGNVAELGLGVLAAFGVKPIGEILLDEKLGLHIAFGRSEHFGGQVGPAQFSSPGAVIHIDRVYVPETQPDVKVRAVDLILEDGSRLPLMRDGDYAVAFE